MLFVTSSPPDGIIRSWPSENHAPGEGETAEYLYNNYHVITEIRASGRELGRCLEILGRNNPPDLMSYIFIGDNAKEIAANWS